MVGNHTRDEITLEELTRQMAGGNDLDDLRHELRRAWRREEARGRLLTIPGPAQVARPPLLPRTATDPSVRQNRPR